MKSVAALPFSLHRSANILWKLCIAPTANGVYARSLSTNVAVPTESSKVTELNQSPKGTVYGGRHTVTLIPGDGIGLEMTNAVKSVFKAANAPIDWEQINMTGEEEKPSELQHALDSLRRNKVGLKGVLFTPILKTGYQSLNLTIRKELDLFANVVVCKSLPGLKTSHNNIDLVIIRENTEGEYSGLEHEVYPGVVESLKVITKYNSERIARFAFDYAVQKKRSKVTAVHKANIMKLGDGLFLKTCAEVSKRYPTSIKHDSLIVDNCTMQLVSKPEQFDVMVMPNLYGNIISNIGAGLVGGPGVVPGANIGHEVALFEPGARHVAHDIQGLNLANPTAMLLSATMMLRHIGLHSNADNIEKAVYKVIQDGKVRTKCMGGHSSTTDFTLAVISEL